MPHHIGLIKDRYIDLLCFNKENILVNDDDHEDLIRVCNLFNLFDLSKSDIMQTQRTDHLFHNKQVQFSEPTYGVGEGFLVKANNPKNLHSYDDVIKQPEVKLGVVVGAIQVDYAKQLNIPDSQVIVFPDAVSALAGVQAGRADVYAATALTVADLMTKTTPDDGLERAEPFTDPVIGEADVRGYGAFAFRNADVEFRDAFNHELREYIGSAEHARLVEPFGFTEQELPQGVTTEKLCAG